MSNIEQASDQELTVPNARSVLISAQNDNFRQSFNPSLGKVVMTSGVAGMFVNMTLVLFHCLMIVFFGKLITMIIL